MTPEGKIKKQVTALLKEHDDLYYFMPVVSGYGQRALDYIGCYRGRFFAIETKAPGKVPTKLQQVTINSMFNAGAVVFVVDGPEGVDQLRDWLELDRAPAAPAPPHEPVAWRYRVKGSSSWFAALKDDRDTAYWRASNYEVEPLYTAPRNDQWEK